MTVARNPQHLDVFWVRPDGAVLSTWWDLDSGWAAPFTVAPPRSATTLAAVARNPQHLDVFWVRPDGGIGSAWWDVRTGWAAPFTVAGPGSAAQGSAALAVVARNPEHLDVFWVRPDQAVGTVWWDVRTGWAAPFPITLAGTATGTALQVVARYPEHLDVFWVRPDGAVASTWWDVRTGWAAPFTVAGPGSSVNPTALAVIARNPDHLDVFWVDRTGAVASAWWDARTGWARPFAVTPGGVADITNTLSVVSRSPRHLEVFWLGRFDSVAALHWEEGSGWSAPLTIAPSRSAAGPVAGIARSQQVIDVFWVTEQGALATANWNRQARPTPTTPAGGRMTTFNPGRTGFQFRNDFATEPVQDVRFGGLCGGMSYAALDYFFAGRAAPRQATLAWTGSPLYQYIYRRQVTSLAENADKWAELAANPFGWRTKEFFNWGLQGFGGGRLQELRQQIDAGRPAPLGLFKAGNGGAGPHHQVVALGYEMGRYNGDLGPFQEDLKIFVYDPNFPNETLTLVPNPATTSYSYLEHPDKSWMTYFVDLKYRPVQPLTLIEAPPAAPGTATQLLLDITTGVDDLRGGNDTVNATVTLRDGTTRTMNNLNFGSRWIPNYQQRVLVRLNPSVRIEDITGVVLSTTYSGDNWNVDELKVSAGDTLLFRAAGTPLVRFTGTTRTFTAPIRR